MTRVIWSPSSIDDLQSIRAYIEQFNPRAARELAARLVEAGNSLQSFPSRGHPVADNLREWRVVFPYIIRYEILGLEVHVLGFGMGAVFPQPEFGCPRARSSATP